MSSLPQKAREVFIFFHNQERIAKNSVNYKVAQNQVILYLYKWDNDMVSTPAKRHCH